MIHDHYDVPPATLGSIEEARRWRTYADEAGEISTVRALDGLIDAWRRFGQAGDDLTRHIARARAELDAITKQLADGLHTELSVSFVSGHAQKLAEAQKARTEATERVLILAHVLDVKVSL